MDVFQRILDFFKQFRFSVRPQTSSEIALKALKKWGEPTIALTHLLNVDHPTFITLEAACIIWGKIAASNPVEHIQLLGNLLQRLPAETRSNALLLAAHDHPVRQVSLLIDLAPLRLEGFTSLAAAMKEEWDQQQRNDDLALAFYSLVSAYGVPPYAAAASHVRVLLSKGDYEKAEAVLLDVLAKHSQLPADLYWSFLSIEHYLKRSPQGQIEGLTFFIQRYPADQRLGQAWCIIGDLYGSSLMDAQKALDAYLRAEQRGQLVPQLQAYRLGNWDAIPALCTHPDYPFPPIVAVDLEVDPQPGTLKGSRVFEVAAVRYKGKTCLEHYHSYIQRDFFPAKWTRETATERLSNAPLVQSVAQQLRRFIGDAFLIGHNVRAFDAPELEGMGVPVVKERMIDTLTLARLLHPDSLHHHLSLLCQHYHIPIDPVALHSALPDAYACAQLFHAFGEDLLQREAGFLAGIRALVIPGSAFDRAILQPRYVPADPTLTWELEPTPALPRIITPLRGNQASPTMQEALGHDGDCFVEHTDFDAGYCQSLDPQHRSFVTFNSRTRIERALVGSALPPHLFVLPHPKTLLCPKRLCQAIEASTDDEQKLALFCLYQASHNHDAATLYPLRLPLEALEEPLIDSLRQMLLEACCSNEPGHPDDCPARQAVQYALATRHLFLSTHENLLARQATVPEADTIVIDDIADLQMHLAEDSAYVLSSRDIKTWLSSPEERHVVAQLETAILAFAQAYMPDPSYRERLPLSSLLTYLEQSSTHTPTLLLESLRTVSERGAGIGNVLQKYFTRATQEPTSPASFHAYWIDLWFAADQTLYQWNICGLSQDLRDIFQQRCWKPYKKHILAGSALTTGGQNTQFLQRCLNIPGHLPLKRDPRLKKRICLPLPEAIPPAGFLQRRKWIKDIGRLLATEIQGDQRAVLVTFNNTTAVDVLLSTFLKTHATAGRQLLAPQLNWTVTKINERMHDPERRLLIFASPRLRQTLLASPVDLEVSGPLRFLNKRDPVVAAQMHVFAHLYPREGPFHAYLLPQALLELKSRLSSEAKVYVICDGSLLSKGYRDEVLQMLHEDAEVQELSKTDYSVPGQILETLEQELMRVGLGNQVAISDADLSLVLRSLWDTDTFRSFPPLEQEAKPVVTQKDIVRAALERKDQLVVAATGGGKSLCFQLPAILLAEEVIPKVTLVFSPLIALMSNQVEHLNRKGIFSAIMLNSTLSLEQRQEHLEGLKKGLYSLVYLAPEQIYSTKLREALQYREIGLIAIDEAHCVSQWGHNFRTDYFMLRKWIHYTLCPHQKREFPLLALTATARKGYKDRHNEECSDQASTVGDIIEKLGLRISENEIVMSSAIRPELAFHFEYVTPTHTCPQCASTYEYQLERGNCPNCGYRSFTRKRDVQHIVTELKKQRLLALLGPDPQHKVARLPDLYPRWSQPYGTRQRGLIYCAYQRTTEEIAAHLQARIPHLRLSAYHAGMETAEREEILRRFTSDTEDGLDVIVSTNAFGMGIDVRRLGFVIHFDTPATPEAYYQEAGRAGRDRIFKEGKERAACILLFHPSDLEKQRFLSSKTVFSDYEIEDVYKALCGIYERSREYPRAHLSTSDTLPFQSEAADALSVFASVQEIALRAGVEEEQVGTLLYYLEEHTTDRLRHNRVLE